MREWYRLLTNPRAMMVLLWIVVAYAIPYLLRIRKPPPFEVR